MSSPNRRLLRYASADIWPLSQNAAHQAAARYALSLYAQDAVYSFIPKNACSTLRYSLALANGAISGPKQFNWIHANNQTFRATLPELAKAKYTFVVLRDPFLRIASCYLDKIVGLTDVAWHYHALTNYRLEPAMVTFRDFVTGLRPRLRSNEHWRPQVDFLVYETYDDYFCVESFADAARHLREKIGFEVQDARQLTRHGSEQFEPLEGDASFADTPAHEIASLKRSGRIPRYTQMYDADLVAAIGRLYAADIAFYTSTMQRSCIFRPVRREAEVTPTEPVEPSAPELPD
jgi:hypothetical protein